jgi:Protein of unknown function (DUF3631)
MSASAEQRAQEILTPEGQPGQGAKVIQKVYDYIGRFVAYPSVHARVAHAFWIAHTHLMEEWESTPRIAFLSAEAGSGKTRALEITETLVPNPVQAVNASPAYIFRRISAPEGLPTILFDEIDTVFGPKARENEELRGVINAGHRRGAMAGRCVIRGKEVQTEELPAYAALAVAGLHSLPDTILTRSVLVKMQRRAPGEKVEPYRRRQHAHQGHAIRDQLAAWASTLTGKLGDVWANLPPGVEDRAADVWEPLIIVADAAGSEWPTRVRVAAEALVAESRQSAPSLGVRLLADLRSIFDAKQEMSTSKIVTNLCALEESPWGDIKGKPIDPRRLSRFLDQYGVHSRNVRVGAEVVKGYRREDLHDPWSRYIAPPLAAESATSATGATDPGELVIE